MIAWMSKLKLDTMAMQYRYYISIVIMKYY